MQRNPVCNAFMNCLGSVTNPNLYVWVNSVNNLRNFLVAQNPKLEGTQEIEPRTVLACLLGQLYKELNSPQTEQDKSNKYLIILGEEEAKTSKIEMMMKFINKI